MRHSLSKTVGIAHLPIPTAGEDALGVIFGEGAEGERKLGFLLTLATEGVDLSVPQLLYLLSPKGGIQVCMAALQMLLQSGEARNT